MNPTGLRLEEKKSADYEVRSVHSYKSTHSTRSSVLERAREYNRRIVEQNNNLSGNSNNTRRSRSMERASSEAGSSAVMSTTPRSKSAGRVPQSAPVKQNQIMTRERAMQSVRREAAMSPVEASPQTPNPATNLDRYDNSSSYPNSHQQQQQQAVRTPTTSPAPTRRPVTSTPGGHHSQFHQQQQQQQQQAHPNDAGSSRKSASSSRGNSSSRTPASRSGHQPHPQHSHHHHRPKLPSPTRSSAKSASGRHHNHHHNHANQNGNAAGDNNNNEAAVVTPELLVDALSGHEDGLLAIAEKLMEHYDAGYDVMGEAIIDAFADVQKLFQHVVEAAHMEGAAFEASRRDSEQQEQAAAAGTANDPVVVNSPGDASSHNNHNATSPAGVSATGPGAHHRHDEFIDQDVKDVLTEAIRKGTALRDSGRHKECFDLFENACQAASSLLPVDSDHRGRLQLSIARAESMSPDRANAILRYAMDDVLRSGLRAGRTPLPDPSKRADVVLSRQGPTGSAGSAAASYGPAGIMGVVQSSDEALASLMEEMKEILNAPVYNDTPLQDVARRFWAALNEAQKSQLKKEERLEQNLAQLKGEFLLARAEWEEKLTQANETADSYKDKYANLKERVKSDGYLDQARSFAANRMDGGSGDGEDNSNHDMSMFSSVKSHASNKAGSVASLGSGLAQHARTIVTSMNNNFNCNNLNERNGPVVNSELTEMRDVDPRATPGRNTRSHHHHHHHQRHHHQQHPHGGGGGGGGGTFAPSSASSVRSGTSGRSRSRSKASRSFREYSQSPQRVDV